MFFSSSLPYLILFLSQNCYFLLFICHCSGSFFTFFWLSSFPTITHTPGIKEQQVCTMRPKFASLFEISLVMLSIPSKICNFLFVLGRFIEVEYNCHFRVSQSFAFCYNLNCSNYFPHFAHYVNFIFPLLEQQILLYAKFYYHSLSYLCLVLMRGLNDDIYHKIIYEF